MEKLFLNARELAARWNIKTRTLSQWRWRKKGPDFSKISGRVTYSLEVINQFE